MFSEEERAAIRFAESLTAWPNSIQESDLSELSRHFTAEQITDLVLTIATANLTNRFNEGMRTPVDT